MKICLNIILLLFHRFTISLQRPLLKVLVASNVYCLPSWVKIASQHHPKLLLNPVLLSETSYPWTLVPANPLVTLLPPGVTLTSSQVKNFNCTTFFCINLGSFKMEFAVRYTRQITALIFFAILIFTDISIKIHSLYALSRPRSNLDL